MNKKIKFLSVIMLLVLGLTACKSDELVVVSREEGSGTRSAFIELTGVLEKNDAGEKHDMTTEEAITQMQTETVIQTVAGNEFSIGYISTGSLSDKVKGLRVDGSEPSIENIKSGAYKISRPFLLVTQEASPLIDDFIAFSLSDQGQALVEESYIAVEEGRDYQASQRSGTLTIAGSTSVAPVIEKLAEAYKDLNPEVNIEIQQNGSSAGIMAASEGTADIGMSSRNLSPEEEASLNKFTLAMDGIAVIVNQENPLEDIGMEDLRRVFVGEINSWKDLKGNE